MAWFVDFPGGKLELNDFKLLPKDTVNAWYNALENTLRREVREEVGLEIKNIEYVTSIVAEYGDTHGLISMLADHHLGEIKLQPEETDQFAWVTLKEAKDYELIDGIYDELAMAEARRNGQKFEWKRVNV